MSLLTDLLTRVVNNTQLGYTPKSITQQGTLSILASSAGVLHAVNVGQNSCPTLTIYDNASGASGTVLAFIEPGAKQSYVYDVSYVNGASAFLASGNAPVANVSLR